MKTQNNARKISLVFIILAFAFLLIPVEAANRLALIQQAMQQPTQLSTQLMKLPKQPGKKLKLQFKPKPNPLRWSTGPCGMKMNRRARL